MKISVLDTKEDLLKKGCRNIEETLECLGLANAIAEDYGTYTGRSVEIALRFAKRFSGAEEISFPAVVMPKMKEAECQQRKIPT